MAFATKIIDPAFQKTKETLFPIDKKYWMKMGLVSLASAGNYASGNGNSMGDGSSFPDTNGLSIREIVAKFNVEALDFFKAYGKIIGILFAILYLFALFISYINSVLYFVFIQGVIEKKIEVRKSFKANRPLGASLFIFRALFGIISLIAFGICVYPLISAFLNNRLAYFNLWLLIPIVLGIIIISLISGVISFIVEDFLVVIMFLKKIPMGASFTAFKEIASGKKFEIFLYWLMKILLGIAGTIISAVIAVLLLIPYALVCLLFALIGVGIYLLAKALLIPLIIIGVILFTAIIMLFIYNLSVFLLPVRVFFQYYAILMVEALEGKTNDEKKEDSSKTADAIESKNTDEPKYASEKFDLKSIDKKKPKTKKPRK